MVHSTWWTGKFSFGKKALFQRGQSDITCLLSEASIWTPRLTGTYYRPCFRLDIGTSKSTNDPFHNADQERTGMKVEPSALDWAYAKSVYDEFSQKPGAQHIASEFALAHLGAVLNKVKPNSVLEFGAGIGTITHFLLKHPANIGHVTTTENNPYCLDQLIEQPNVWRLGFPLISHPGIPI